MTAKTLQYGNGVHQWNVPLSKVLQFGEASTLTSACAAMLCLTYSQLVSAVEIAYCPVIFATKLAILLQIMHVFVTNRTSVRFYLVQFLIWSNALWYIINIFMTAFQCTPRKKIWDPMIPGHCFVNFDTINFTAAIINVVSDVFMFVLPILWVWELHMAWKRKFGVSLIFASGIL